jgi:hypothetical protein
MVVVVMDDELQVVDDDYLRRDIADGLQRYRRGMV